MAQVIAITGAATGFGAVIARHLARAGHTVYATMQELDGRNAAHRDNATTFASDNKVDLRVAELDVLDEQSAEKAIARIIEEAGRLDCLIHNAGHMCLGAAEAFTPEQYMSYFDINVLGAQRVNRAALPSMRNAGKGLMIWIGSTSTRGGTPPFLAPYFAAKAAMDSGRVVCLGIESVGYRDDDCRTRRIPHGYGVLQIGWSSHGYRHSAVI